MLFIFCTHIVFGVGLVDFVVMVQWDHLVVMKRLRTWAMVDMMEEWRSKYL